MGETINSRLSPNYIENVVTKIVYSGTAIKRAKVAPADLVIYYYVLDFHGLRFLRLFKFTT